MHIVKEGMIEMDGFGEFKPLLIGSVLAPVIFCLYTEVGT